MIASIRYAPGAHDLGVLVEARGLIITGLQSLVGVTGPVVVEVDDDVFATTTNGLHVGGDLQHCGASRLVVSGTSDVIMTWRVSVR